MPDASSPADPIVFTESILKKTLFATQISYTVESQSLTYAHLVNYQKLIKLPMFLPQIALKLTNIDLKLTKIAQNSK